MYFTENMTGPQCVKPIYEAGAPVGISIRVKNPTLGMSLSRLEDFSVTFNNTVYTADQLTFVLRGIHYNFAQMQTIATVHWEFGEEAELIVPRPGLGAVGFPKIEVAIGFRMGFESVQWRRKSFQVTAFLRNGEEGAK